jgi:hypothetical protein
MFSGGFDDFIARLLRNAYEGAYASIRAFHPGSQNKVRAARALAPGRAAKTNHRIPIVNIPKGRPLTGPFASKDQPRKPPNSS